MALTLYHLPSCPFCIRVRQVADDLGIPLQLIDVARDRAAYDSLLDRRGRGTVPVLGIPTPDGERLLPESDDIIAYLRRNAEALTAA
ncbi:MAG: glutathione S-transferase N-terminal domain-containing protein [Myxococcota bacterium]